MNHYKYILGIICIAFSLQLFSEKTFAQTDEGYNKVSIASPTAGSLTKFVDIPVSLNTGIPEINIPLHTVRDGSLSLPISMSYHASGLKVAETAGWVGAGWALNAGGVITRSVRGQPDEKYTVSQFQQTGFFSDYGYRTHLIDSHTAGGRPDPVLPDSSYLARYIDFAEGRKDSEPDLFFFNFAGYSGKFYFNDDRTPMLLPEQDIKIEYNYNYNSSQSIQGFTLTTPDGVKYYFGATPSTTDVDPVEYTKVFTSQNGYGVDRVLSSWYLNKIVSPDGTNVIDLKYHAANYSYFATSTSPVGRDERGYNLIRNYVHGVELENITSSNGQVNFIPTSWAREDLSNDDHSGQEGVNTMAKALDRIEILKKNGQVLLKSYQFSYSYFEDNTSSVATILNVSVTDKKRLKLLSIQEKASNGALNPPYKFDYFNEPVPRRMSFGQDHWGFVNGITTNADQLIGTYYKETSQGNVITVPGADRDPHWPAMRGGTLSKITYPTGGFTSYEFESNKIVETSISGTNSERILINNYYAGFDGCQCPKLTSVTLPIDYYQYVFSLNNKNNGGTAWLKIYNSNNVLMDQISAGLNQTVEITRNYPSGNYRFDLLKENAYGGQGATFTLYRLAGSMVVANADVGGLRIKSIRQNSGNGNPDMVTTYDYTEGDNQRSSGVLFGKPTVAQVIRNDIYKDFWNDNHTYVGGCPVVDSSPLAFLISAGSIRPMNSSQGSHIGYRKVTVRQAGNGYTSYFFNTEGESTISPGDIVNRYIITTPFSCDPSIPNYPSAPEPNAYKRGQLQYKATYNETGVLLTDASYSSDYQENPITTPAFVVALNASINNGTLMATWYDQKTARKINETVVNNNYINGNIGIESKDESFFESPFHHQLTRKRTVNSTGDVLETKFSYVPDFTIANVDGLDNGLTNYNANLASAKSTYDAYIASCTGDRPCQRIHWLDYDVVLSHLRLNFINYRIPNFTSPNNTYLTRLQSALTTVSADLKPIIDMRLQNNFALVETVNLKNDQIIDATYNTYAYKSSSLNKIYLAKVSKTEFIVPPSSFTYTKTGTDNVSLVKDASYKEKAAFEYISGNIVEVKQKDNNPTSYQWGYNGQYPTASAKNARFVNIFFEGFEDGNGNSALNDSKTGHYSRTGGFSKALSGLDNGAYLLTYYQKVSGVWQWVTFNVTVSSNSYTVNIPGQVDDVRFSPAGAMMTSYTYDPEIGMTSTMDQNGVTSYYEYDEFQRLRNIKDKDHNILKRYYYHYTGAPAGGGEIPGLYFNTMQSQVYNKQGCTTGMQGIYVVRDSVYSSSISLADANNKALADIAANGQNYVNSHGSCFPYAAIVQTSTTTGTTQNMATYEIRLYSDENRTTPFTTSQSITVNYKVTTYTSVNNGTPTVTYTNKTAVIAAGTNYKAIGSFENGCGNGGGVVSVVAQGSQSAKVGGGQTNLLPPGGGGGDTTCVTKSLELLTGTGYTAY